MRCPRPESHRPKVSAVVFQPPERFKFIVGIELDDKYGNIHAYAVFARSGPGYPIVYRDAEVLWLPPSQRLGAREPRADRPPRSKAERRHLEDIARLAANDRLYAMYVPVVGGVQ